LSFSQKTKSELIVAYTRKKQAGKKMDSVSEIKEKLQRKDGEDTEVYIGRLKTMYMLQTADLLMLKGTLAMQQEMSNKGDSLWCRPMMMTFSSNEAWVDPFVNADCTVCGRADLSGHRTVGKTGMHYRCEPCDNCGKSCHYKYRITGIKGIWSCECLNDIPEEERREIVTKTFVSECVVHSGVEEARQICGMAVKWNGQIVPKREGYRSLGDSTLSIIWDMYIEFCAHGHLKDDLLKRAWGYYKGSHAYKEGEFEPVYGRFDDDDAGETIKPAVVRNSSPATSSSNAPGCSNDGMEIEEVD
jgi:hypothetical protein